MPNRIIKESIKRSPEIDRLSWFEEVVFYRLIVTADDFGRLDGRPVVLKNDLFPTKDTITRKAVEDALEKLVSVGLLTPYVDAESGMPYYFFPKWQNHQRIRDSKAKYPAPTEETILRGNSPQVAASRRELPQVAASCGLESESEYESEYESNPKERNARAARFTPPTVEQVSAYAREKGYAGFDAQRFCDFYASNGWKVGKNPMKDWQAAVRGWASRDKDKPTARNQMPTYEDVDWDHISL